MGTIDWISLGYNFGSWEEKDVWRIALPSSEMAVSDFLWHFEVPYWENDDGEEFAVSAWDVVRGKSGSSKERLRTEQADLNFPIDVLHHNEKWFVLDGLHRLTKSYLCGQEKISVRIFPNARLAEIVTSG